MTTTIKIQEETKSELDSFKGESNSYDNTIKILLNKVKRLNLKEELIEGYSQNFERDSKINSDWDATSNDL